ncbi:MAG: transcription antitermination factor NusB [Bacteroidales bacterium]|nr:transcription antitermination factor NusB [Bacteroidales bacterium]
MISRRYLRIKVMQAIFAHQMNDKEDVAEGERKLTAAIQSCYTLFIYFFSLFSAIYRYRVNKLEDLKNKINPTEADLNPNTKFVDNKVILQIDENVTLNKLYKELKINWGNDADFIVQVNHEILNLPEYQEYMKNAQRSYKEDKDLVLAIVEKVFVESELIHWFFEEKNIHWFDDYNEALLMLYKNIQQFKESQGNHCTITSLFKETSEDEESDMEFYKRLYTLTLAHNREYEERIEQKLQNWELERMMGIDIILLKMALCEFTEFPSIPVKVTINEYIELAKTYSSGKSKVFINGMLDKMAVDLKEEGKLNKMGRGLV